MQVRMARAQYVRWLRITRELSPHTIRAYDGDIAAFERHLGSQAVVTQIDYDRLIAFMEEQRAVGLSPASRRRRASALRGFCRWLMASHHLTIDPWNGTTVAVGRSRRLPRLVRPHDLQRLLASLRTSAHVDGVIGPNHVLERPDNATTLLAVALMVATGLRVSEITSINCHDIDLCGRSLRVVGKGSRERQVFLTNAWINSLTRAYLSTRTALGVPHARLLFNRHREPMSPPAMRARLVTAAREAGLEIRVTPHMLRHSAATQLLEAGVDTRYVQRLLGHASLSTTEIYTHVSNRALRRVISDADVLGRLL